MFVAWRELLFARGRFVLIALVVTMMMLLVGFLTGLTGGLASQNVSAVLGFKADRVVFSMPESGQKLDFSESALNHKQYELWANQPGVDTVTPLSVQQSRVSAGDVSTTVALMGTSESEGAPVPDQATGITLSQTAADTLSVSAGESVDINGTLVEIAGVADDSWFSHTPTAWMSTEQWHKLTHSPQWAQVLIVRGDADWDAADGVAGTQSASALGSLLAIGSFTSEAGSLGMMVGLLFAISALVLGAFFTVWTMQRLGDIAVLKALGASTRTLVVDALGQALVVLLAGISLGLLLVLGFGTLLDGVLPFVISPVTTIAPAAVMGVLGLLGVVFALRSMSTANPLTALGGKR